jgi:hypothetical protein
VTAVTALSDFCRAGVSESRRDWMLGRIDGVRMVGFSLVREKLYSMRLSIENFQASCRLNE